MLVTNLSYSNWFAGISSNRINIWGIYIIFWSMLGWWNHGTSTLGWSQLQGCSRDHQDDKSTFTMNSSWLGSPITQRYLQYPDDRKSGLSIVLVPLEKGGDHFRTHERHDFHLQRKGVVEAKDVRFPPQSKWIETVGQKIGICEMQCCSDMVRYIYIYMGYIWSYTYTYTYT